MKSRHAIFEDRDFWSHLEFALTGWLAEQAEKDLRHFWIDGFIPDGINDSKYGADVEGEAWVGTSAGGQSAYRFVISIPQSLLHRTTRKHCFTKVQLNPEMRELEITIQRTTNNAAQAGTATRYSPSATRPS